MVFEGMGRNPFEFESLFVEFVIVSVECIQHYGFPPERGQEDEEIGGKPNWAQFTGSQIRKR